jgi:cellulose/xylan binding protein with CBM9 domain
MRKSLILLPLLILCLATMAWGHYPPGEFLFAVQFPDENLPTVDGNIAEWSVIPQIPYEVGNDMMSDAVYSKVRGEIDVSDLSVRQIVGWNDNNNRLYIMAEVFDNVHNADREDPAQFWADDAWEIYINPTHEDGGDDAGLDYTIKQSFNFAMPPIGGNWGQNLPDFEWRVDPFNNDTWQLDFSFEGEEFGESTYYYELWIQPLDFIPEDGDREAAEETDLEEGQIIAMSWTFGDFDEPGTTYQGFWSTSPNGCCRADNDMVMSEMDDSIDWGAAPTAVESNTWGRIKAQFSE